MLLTPKHISRRTDDIVINQIKIQKVKEAKCIVVIMCKKLKLSCHAMFISKKIAKRIGVILKSTHFPRYWPFGQGIHRSPGNFQQKCQWRGALMFSLISAWINGWVNNPEADDLRRHPFYFGHNAFILDDIIEDRHTSNPCLTRLIYVLLITSQLIEMTLQMLYATQQV